MRLTGGIVLVLLAQGLVGCGGRAPVSPTAPTTTTTTTTPAPQPAVTRVVMTGNVTLTRVGETTQLTAMATLSDNTTKDVTKEARWSGGDARVATVGPSGLVTVVGFGATWISATYQSRGASMTDRKSVV